MVVRNSKKKINAMMKAAKARKAKELKKTFPFSEKSTIIIQPMRNEFNKLKALTMDEIIEIKKEIKKFALSEQKAAKKE